MAEGGICRKLRRKAFEGSNRERLYGVMNQRRRRNAKG
jgi:hypothetical protein